MQGDGAFVIVEPEQAANLLVAIGRIVHSVCQALPSSTAKMVGAIDCGEVALGRASIAGFENPVFAGLPVILTSSVLKSIPLSCIAVSGNLERHLAAGAALGALNYTRHAAIDNGGHFVVFKLIDSPTGIGEQSKNIDSQDGRYDYQIRLSDSTIATDLTETSDWLLGQLGASLVLHLEPIGSYGIQGLTAKPIVDLLLVPRGRAGLTQLLRKLPSLGFESISLPELPKRLFWRLRGASGEPRLHLHVVDVKEWEHSRERRFRRLLLENQALRAAYSRAKELIIECACDPESYGRWKAAFIDWASRMAVGESLAQFPTGERG
jgi:GrpB-like predicted nucleotidyltransferase (UPF0157 family)